MRPHEVESWALDIVERVRTNQPIEDTRVELKAEWIPAEKAARRIAGHANAARGAPVLWLIGVDEKRGVVGAEQNELANRYEQVKAQFNGLAPRLSDYDVPVDDKTVVALLFETDRAPFVVKNPAYGKKDGGPVELEVPWREGTKVRSATRSDLLRLLSPLQALPSFEVLGGELAREARSHEFHWSLHLELYAEIPFQTGIVIPFHRCKATFEAPGSAERRPFRQVSLSPPPRVPYGPYSESGALLSLTINSTSDEILLSGPGKLHLYAHHSAPTEETSIESDITIRFSCLPVGADHPVTFEAKLPCAAPKEGETHRWVMESASAPDEGS